MSQDRSSARRRLPVLLFVALLAALGGCASSARAGADSIDGALPSARVRSPHPATFSLGNAIAPINYHMTAWTLTDLIRTAGFEAEVGDTRPSRMWVPVIAGEWDMPARHLVASDERGWPTSMELEDGRRADALSTLVMAAEPAGVYPDGVYRLSWAGQGEILVEGAAAVSEPLTPAEPGRQPAGGRTRVEVTFRSRGVPGEDGLIITILETDPEGTGDYLRDLRLLRPDAPEPVIEGVLDTPKEVASLLHPRYVEELRPLSVIRPLHFFGDQLTYGPPVAWEERTRLEDSHWGGALGAPYELAAVIANEAAADLWVNVPIAADDRYVRELARLMREWLAPERRLYLELGNELWNWADPYNIGREWALARARERWPGVEGQVQPWSDGDPVNELMMLYSWQGTRTAEIAAIAREVFAGQAERVVVVLAGQLGASSPFWFPSRYLLESPVAVAEEGLPPAAASADAFAVAAYVGEAPGEIEFPRRSAAAFIAGAAEFVRGEGRWGPQAPEPGMRYLFRSDAELAAEFGLPLIAYEGGQHFTGSRFTRDVVNTHPDMYGLYRTLFRVWREEGGGLFVHYAGTIPRGVSPPGEEPGYYESEHFGIRELQTQEPAEAPKWRAMLDEIAAGNEAGGQGTAGEAAAGQAAAGRE